MRLASKRAGWFCPYCGVWYRPLSRLIYHKDKCSERFVFMRRLALKDFVTTLMLKYRLKSVVRQLVIEAPDLTGRERVVILDDLLPAFPEDILS